MPVIKIAISLSERVHKRLVRLKKTYYHDKSSPAVADGIVLLDEKKKKEEKRIRNHRRRQDTIASAQNKAVKSSDSVVEVSGSNT